MPYACKRAWSIRRCEMGARQRGANPEQRLLFNEKALDRYSVNFPNWRDCALNRCFRIAKACAYHEACASGVLDQSPSEGSNGADALRNTLDLARLAEDLGYERLLGGGAFTGRRCSRVPVPK